MEILKLKSVRLSKKTLAKAEELSRGRVYYSTSDVIRLAIWIGLKVLKPGVFHKLSPLMWREENDNADYSLQDVLQAVGEELENLKSLE